MNGHCKVIVRLVYAFSLNKRVNKLKAECWVLIPRFKMSWYVKKGCKGKFDKRITGFRDKYQRMLWSLTELKLLHFLPVFQSDLLWIGSDSSWYLNSPFILPTFASEPTFVPSHPEWSVPAAQASLVVCATLNSELDHARSDRSGFNGRLHLRYHDLELGAEAARVGHDDAQLAH